MGIPDADAVLVHDEMAASASASAAHMLQFRIRDIIELGCRRSETGSREVQEVCASSATGPGYVNSYTLRSECTQLCRPERTLAEGAHDRDGVHVWNPCAAILHAHPHTV